MLTEVFKNVDISFLTQREKQKIQFENDNGEKRIGNNYRIRDGRRVNESKKGKSETKTGFEQEKL